jgi:hypothetical protein
MSFQKPEKDFGEGPVRFSTFRLDQWQYSVRNWIVCETGSQLRLLYVVCEQFDCALNFEY